MLPSLVTLEEARVDETDDHTRSLTVALLHPEMTHHCPRQERAASTTAAYEDGFVEASPSRVLRDGEGTTFFKLSHGPGCGSALISRD
jgi:hypothetical protein